MSMQQKNGDILTREPKSRSKRQRSGTFLKINQQHIAQKFMSVHFCNDPSRTSVIGDVRGISRQNISDDLVGGAISPLHQGRVNTAYDLLSLYLVHSSLFSIAPSLAFCQSRSSWTALPSISKISSMGMAVPSVRITRPSNGSIFLILPTAST